MYWLKENIEVDFGITKDYEVANRIGITPQTLSKILNKKTGCSKPVANYICLLNEMAINKRYSDKHIEKYFIRKA